MSNDTNEYDEIEFDNLSKKSGVDDQIEVSDNEVVEIIKWENSLIIVSKLYAILHGHYHESFYKRRYLCINSKGYIVTSTLVKGKNVIYDSDKCHYNIPININIKGNIDLSDVCLLCKNRSLHCYMLFDGNFVSVKKFKLLSENYNVIIYTMKH